MLKPSYKTKFSLAKEDSPRNYEKQILFLDKIRTKIPKRNTPEEVPMKQSSACHHLVVAPVKNLVYIYFGFQRPIIYSVNQSG